MPSSRSPFSYAVLRVVPDIEREEFVNAGLVLFCRSLQYLNARSTLDAEGLASLRPDADLDALRAQLTLVERIAAGDIPSGPLAGMSQSTAVQPGPTHGGMTDDPAATFDHLYATLVDRPTSSEESETDGTH